MSFFVGWGGEGWASCQGCFWCRILRIKVEIHLWWRHQENQKVYMVGNTVIWGASLCGSLTRACYENKRVQCRVVSPRVLESLTIFFFGASLPLLCLGLQGGKHLTVNRVQALDSRPSMSSLAVSSWATFISSLFCRPSSVKHEVRIK